MREARKFNRALFVDIALPLAERARFVKPGDEVAPGIRAVDAAGHAIPIADPDSANQLETLRRNVAEFGVPYIDALAAAQGIVKAPSAQDPDEGEK